jgi:type II secretory pathway component GspD/PulD (secretin)
MKANHVADSKLRTSFVLIFAGLTLALAIPAHSAAAQSRDSDVKPGDQRSAPETYETFYLANVTQANEFAEITTTLRNMVPKARIYNVQFTGAISLRATAEDMAVAKKIITDLDRLKKTYRITYTMTETDGGKPTASRHFSLIVSAGGKTSLKQGTKVPIVTGSFDSSASKQETQVQYMDVGLNIDASLEEYGDGRVRVHSKVEQSAVADEKSGLGAQDPVLRQTTLDSMSVLTQGQPLVLGSLDVPGSTKRQDVEVVSELVK